MLTDAQLAEIEQRWDLLWHKAEMEMAIPVELLAGAELDVEHLLVEVRRLRGQFDLLIETLDVVANNGFPRVPVAELRQQLRWAKDNTTPDFFKDRQENPLE